MSKRILKASVVDEYFNNNAILPYGLKIKEVKQAMIDTYQFLFEVNDFLVKKELPRLEDLLLGNSLSGLISEILVKNLDKNSTTLVRNKKVGGHPDLILKGRYPNDEALRAEEGIEIKSSKQKGGWQGHNPEECWLMVFRYILGDSSSPIYERKPIEFVQVLAAKLSISDWSFSGRRGTSRRTITASITASGMDKLRSNPIYQNPRFIVAPNKELKRKYQSIIGLD
jgi:hypothetical protein